MFFFFFKFNQESVLKKNVYKLNRSISRAKLPNFDKKFNFKDQINLLRYVCKTEPKSENTQKIKQILLLIDTLPFFPNKDLPKKVEGDLTEYNLFTNFIRYLELKIAELNIDFYLSTESDTQQKKIYIKAYKALKKVLISRIKLSPCKLGKEHIFAYELSLLAMHANTRTIINALSSGQLKPSGGKGKKQKILASLAKEWLLKNSRNCFAVINNQNDLREAYKNLLQNTDFNLPLSQA